MKLFELFIMTVLGLGLPVYAFVATMFIVAVSNGMGIHTVRCPTNMVPITQLSFMGVPQSYACLTGMQALTTQ